IVGLALLASAGFSTSTAHANGRFPGAVQLVFRGDAGAMTTSFGVITSTDHFIKPEWVCETALGYDPIQNNELGVAMFPSGRILISGPGGLTASTDLGCSNPKVNGVPETAWMTDVSVDEQTRQSGIAIARGGPDGDCNGNLYETKDEGVTWG